MAENKSARKERKDQKRKPQPAKAETATVKKPDGPKPETKKEQQPEGMRGQLKAVIAIIAVIAIAAFVVLYVLPTYLPSLFSSVPFSTFKSTFNGASRVAVAVTYGTDAQYINESKCFTFILESISRYRSPSTIDFFILNSTSCTYSSTGLGGSVTPATESPEQCLRIANAEPSIFLNYSNVNSTVITASHLYIDGNSQYMSACPVAVDLS